MEYALALEKSRHFGEAAKACRVTQPTLSQQLQKIEDELGLILFDRRKKPILLTPEGKLFLEQAKIVLREKDKLIDLSKQAVGGEVSGDFRLAVIPTVSSYLLPLFIRPFSINYPKVRLFIEEMKTETILEHLADDRLDGAILATPLEEAHFKVHPLYYEPFLAYLSKGHALLKEKLVTRKQLNMNDMWLLQDGHCLKDQVYNFCPSPLKEKISSQGQGNIWFQSGSLDTLKRLVENSGGMTLIPAMMAITLDEREKKKYVRAFKPPVPVREISMVYRRDHWKLSMIKAIETTVSNNLPSSISTRPEKQQQVLAI